jgi:hypothetical protein
MTKHSTFLTNRITLPASLTEMDDHQLKQHITASSVAFYNDQPKGLQVDAVASLACRKHCFVRVGTGYGKTRVLEIFYNLFKRKGIVLVLNPLDSLGDDQVKCRVGWLLHETHSSDCQLSISFV